MLQYGTINKFTYINFHAQMSIVQSKYTTQNEKSAITFVTQYSGPRV
jgi:hypothetical protein